MPHAGHIRSFLIHQAVYYGLQLDGQNSKYHYGFDDMDPMDGIPKDLDNSKYEQYLGVPLFKVPSPVVGFGSFAHYYATQYLDAMNTLDVHPEVPYSSNMYRDGQYNDAIKIALDEVVEIRKIYNELGAERPDDWFPFQTICEKCGKLGTTFVYGWDGTKVSYRCEPKLVKWAVGCGHEGSVSPFNGNGKLPWKVEWPASWFVCGTDYETAGKDHFTKNGSRDYGRQIIKRVFKAEEPLGDPYEFFLLGGAKMSSSAGHGITATEAAHILPDYLMRFFIYKMNPKRHLEFSPEGDTIPRIFDDFDSALAAYHQDPASDLGRIIIYALQGQAVPDYSLRFSKVTFLSQMPHVNVRELAAQEKGSELSEAEIKELDTRLKYAKRWLTLYADDSAKFNLQTELPDVELSDEQKKFLTAISGQLKNTEWLGEDIHKIIHQQKNDLSIAPKEAFSALYRIFLNKESGPQAGWFLASLEKDFVIKRLTEAIV